MKEIEIANRTYKIDYYGNVYNQYLHMMAAYTDIYGYKYILVKDKNKRRKYSIHRLVAKAFISNPDNLPQVNHKDGNKANNYYTNLEWVTGSQNQVHSRYVLGNQTGFKDTPVICVETNKRYISTREAWRDTQVNYCHISECVHGKRKTAGGYHWRNAE